MWNFIKATNLFWLLYRQQIGQKVKGTRSTSFLHGSISPDSTTTASSLDQPCECDDNKVGVSACPKHKGPLDFSTTNNNNTNATSNSSLQQVRKAKNSMLKGIQSRRSSLARQITKSSIPQIDLSSPADFYQFYMQSHINATNGVSQQSAWSNWRLRRRKTFADPQLLLAQHNVLEDMHFPHQMLSPPSTLESPSSVDWIKSLPPVAGSTRITVGTPSINSIVESYYTSLIACNHFLKAKPSPDDCKESCKGNGDHCNKRCDAQFVDLENNLNENKSEISVNSENKTRLKFSMDVILGILE